MKTTLNLKTLHGEKTESTMVVEGIKVTGMSGDDSLLLFQNYIQEGRYQLTRKRLQPLLKSRNGNI